MRVINNSAPPAVINKRLCHKYLMETCVSVSCASFLSVSYTHQPSVLHKMRVGGVIHMQSTLIIMRPVFSCNVPVIDEHVMRPVSSCNEPVIDEHAMRPVFSCNVPVIDEHAIQLYKSCKITSRLLLILICY